MLRPKQIRLPKDCDEVGRFFFRSVIGPEGEQVLQRGDFSVDLRVLLEKVLEGPAVFKKSRNSGSPVGIWSSNSLGRAGFHGCPQPIRECSLQKTHNPS